MRSSLVRVTDIHSKKRGFVSREPFPFMVGKRVYHWKRVLSRGLGTRQRDFCNRALMNDGESSPLVFSKHS